MLRWSCRVCHYCCRDGNLVITSLYFESFVRPSEFYHDHIVTLIKILPENLKEKEVQKRELNLCHIRSVCRAVYLKSAAREKASS